MFKKIDILLLYHYIELCRNVHNATVSIRESVDSLCRDGADRPMSPYI